MCSGWSRLLEDALIKLSTVATDIMGVSGRAMLEALIVGQRDPKVLAELARGRMRGKRAALVQALTGRFDDHHAELARVLLDHIDALTTQTDRLTAPDRGADRGRPRGPTTPGPIRAQPRARRWRHHRRGRSHPSGAGPAPHPRSPG
jgi:hypothetical protein